MLQSQGIDKLQIPVFVSENALFALQKHKLLNLLEQFY